ncbi:MAG: TetR/AcrR family transcriptional regulator, partial [Paramuribaculum sp.]|nr:TetR/AcrR family transcriptional regulator [Paramuribaculum sp.]
MVSKTRDKLLEVARNLFMVKGVEHTTMNDIATASERGRRTIYTYFKSKREIYQAVVERESELVISRLREVVQSSVPPEEKLRSYLTIRFG